MKGRPDSYLIILYPATNVKSTPQIDDVLIARQEAARIRPDPRPWKKTRRGKNAMLPIADTSRSRRPSCFTKRRNEWARCVDSSRSGHVRACCAAVGAAHELPTWSAARGARATLRPVHRMPSTVARTDVPGQYELPRRYR